MDYETCVLRNLSYVLSNFPNRNTLKYRRHPLKAMYLMEKIENLLDYFIEVYYSIISDEFSWMASLDFIHMIETATHKILKVSSLIYSNDKDVLRFFNHSQVKIMIEGFCYVVERILQYKYKLHVQLIFS